MSSGDFTRDETEFRQEIEAAVQTHRAAVGPCPRPDLLMAASSGVTFEGSGDVLRHLAVCPLCEQLSRDLAEYEFPPVSEAEDRRMRARWGAAPGRTTRSWWNWRIPAMTAAAAALLAGVVFLRRPAVPPEAISPLPSPAKPAPAFVLTLTKAPIRIPAAAVLTFRGDADDSKAYLADFAAALEPYRKDDYAEAASVLEPVTRKYPKTAEPEFYLGVSLLLMSQNDAAVTSLLEARRRGGGVVRDDISWYLAVALARSGKIADARAEAEHLCARAGDYKTQACAALGQLKAK